MKCPYCGSIDDKVVESKQNVDGSAIRRRRECLSCHGRFTSYEHIKENPLTVTKRNKGVELFDMAKIERGIRKSLEKRPVTEEQLQAARRLYNANVSSYNQQLVTFPASIIGRMRGFAKRDFFEAEEYKMQDVKMDL